MTGSLTGMHLSQAPLVRPDHLQFHKHKWLLAAFAQNMLARPAAIYLVEVHAHIGVGQAMRLLIFLLVMHAMQMT